MPAYLALAWIAVRVTVVGELPFSSQELSQAMGARFLVTERGTELVVSGAAGDVGIAIGDRRRVVDMAGRTGAGAARIVALAVTDLFEESLPAALPPASGRALEVWLHLGAGRGIRDTQPWSALLDLGVAAPYRSWLRLAGEVGFTHVLDPSTIDIPISFDSLAFRVGVGGKLGPLEAYLGPFIAPYWLGGEDAHIGALFGGRVSTRLVVPVTRAIGLSLHLAIDAAVNQAQVLRGETQVVFSSPRIGVAGGVGLSVDLDR